MDRRRFLASSGLLAATLLLRPGLVAAAPVPDIRARDAWGASMPPTGPMEQEAPGDVRFLLVHHSASPNAYEADAVPGILGSFYRHHTGAKGWPDIAYNFLVDRYGRVWEGRAGSLAGPVMGDATGGSQGFALLACFIGDHSTEPPTPEAADAMAGLLAALAHRYAIPTVPGSRAGFVSRGSNLHPAGAAVETPTIAAHRDMSLTACPGDAGYAFVTAELPVRVAALQAALAGGEEPAPSPEEPVADEPGPAPPPGAQASPAAPAPSTPAASTPDPRSVPSEPGGVPRSTAADAIPDTAATPVGGAPRDAASGTSIAVRTATGLLGLTTAGAVAAALAARSGRPRSGRPRSGRPDERGPDA